MVMFPSTRVAIQPLYTREVNRFYNTNMPESVKAIPGTLSPCAQRVGCVTLTWKSVGNVGGEEMLVDIEGESSIGSVQSVHSRVLPWKEIGADVLQSDKSGRFLDICGQRLMIFPSQQQIFM